MNGDVWSGVRLGEEGRLVLEHTSYSGFRTSLSVPQHGSMALRSAQVDGGQMWDTVVQTWSEDVAISDSSFTGPQDALALMVGSPRVEATYVDGGLVVNSPGVVLSDVELGVNGVLSASPVGVAAALDVVRMDGSQAPVNVLAGSIEGAVTWPRGTYVIPRVTVPAGARLDLAPGAVVKGRTVGFWSSSQESALLVTGGELHARGNAPDPMILTSVNGAGGVDTSEPNVPYANNDRWAGITAYGSGDSSTAVVRLQHVKADAATRLLSIDAGADVEISHLEARAADLWSPIIQGHPARLAMSDSTLEAPGEGDMVMVAVGSPDAVLTRNTFRQGSVVHYEGSLQLRFNKFLDVAGVMLNNQGSSSVDARHNWWGDAAGPLDAQPARVVGQVDVTPWCVDVGSGSSG